MHTLRTHKDKIIALFNQTDRHNLDNGMIWYESANLHARQLSIEYNISLSKVVGIMAALSPNNKWERNKIDTRKFLENPCMSTKICTFMSQREKALYIYYGTGDSQEIESILNGIKTKNFFNNILYHDTSQAVTVDMWAFRSVGVEEKTKNIPLVTQAYSELANDLNIMPHQLQAVVWGVIRGSLV